MGIAKRRSIAVSAIAGRVVAEMLEGRQLLSAVLLSEIGDTNGNSGGTSVVDINSHFDDSTTTFVQFTTPLGNYRAQLFDTQKPLTVTNFLSYVNSSAYANTFIHRSDLLSGTTPDIIQGGGYAFPGFAHITTSPPVVNEFSTNGIISNTRGTIAMAKTSDPDSATSEWFVNVHDNSAVLDPTSNSGGFTVFGKVVDADLPTVDAIAAVPRFAYADPFGAIPLLKYSQADYKKKKTPTDKNLIFAPVTVIPDLVSSVLTVTTSSSDPTLVSPSIDSDGNLQLSYGQGTGSAQITVTATAAGGNTVASTFTANVAPFQVTLGGTSGNKSVTYKDSDGTVNTLSVKGAGSVAIELAGTTLTQTSTKGKVAVGGTGDAISIVVTGSDATTSLSLSSKGGNGVTTVEDITTDGPIKSISAKSLTVTDGVTTGGATGAITLGATTGATITLGGIGTGAGAVLSLGTMTDTSITSTGVIKSLKVTSAVDSDATADSIVAPAVASISSAGNFAEDIALPAEANLGSLKVGGSLTGDITAHQIGSISVKGSITGATIAATHSADESPDQATANQKSEQGIQKLSVGGAITDATINSAGSVGSISAGSITGSFIILGNPALTALPTTLAQIAAPATLDALKIKGAFVNTSVTGRYLGKLSVGTVQIDNGGTPFGFAADTIAALAGKAGSLKFSFKKLDTQADFTTQLAGASLSDLVVTLF